MAVDSKIGAVNASFVLDFPTITVVNLDRDVEGFNRMERELAAIRPRSWGHPGTLARNLPARLIPFSIKSLPLKVGEIGRYASHPDVFTNIA